MNYVVRFLSMFQSPQKRLFHCYEDLVEWMEKTAKGDGDRMLIKAFTDYNKAYAYWVT